MWVSFQTSQLSTEGILYLGWIPLVLLSPPLALSRPSDIDLLLEHELPRRAYGLIGHEGCSCLDGGCEPLISSQDALSRYCVDCVVRRRALALSVSLGVALNLTPVDPIKALYWSAVINGVLAAPVMVI
jgi:hypothetical protein